MGVFVSSRKFTIYAFMGSNGIYVAYEFVHSTYVDNIAEWYLSTNVEMFVGSAKTQAFVSANNSTQNVKTCAMKTVQNGSLYTTTVELIITYTCASYTGTESSVKVGFACKTGGETAPGMTEGNTGDWWCGPRHASNAQSTIAKAGGITA